MSCIEQTNRMLAERMPALAIALLGRPTSVNRTEQRFRSRGSLLVNHAGRRQGWWTDFETGESGDAVGLIAHTHRVPMSDALRWARDWLGASGEPEPPPAARRPITPPERLDEPSWTDALARSLWRETVDAAGTPADLYLRRRGLRLPGADVLRFHPRCPRGSGTSPAMVAAMTCPVDGGLVGVHRTFIDHGGSKVPDATGNAKKMLGKAGVIRLVPDAEVTLGLGLAEGIETSLAVMQRHGWRPVWVACSAGGIARFPVMDGIEALTVFADHDDHGAGTGAALRCVGRWTAAGREAQVWEPPPGTDFADRSKDAA